MMDFNSALNKVKFNCALAFYDGRVLIFQKWNFIVHTN